MNTEPTLPLTDLTMTDMAEADAAESPDATASAGLKSATEPRTRWAAIIWGLFFAAIAWTGIWLLSDSDRRAGVTDWIADLDPGTITVMIVLSVGILVLIAGLVGLIRHAQRRLTESTRP